MPKTIKINNGSLEYKNNKWYRNGKPLNTNNYLYVDSRGYKHKLAANGDTPVADVDKLGKPIKAQYIGGTTKEARNKFWKTTPIIAHAVDSIANRYGLNPQLLRERLNHEGYTDEQIKKQNNAYQSDNSRMHSGYMSLTDDITGIDALNQFGLDDMGTYISNNTVNLINEDWSDGEFVNEKGRTTIPAVGRNTLSNMGIMAAGLKAFRDIAKTRYPNETNSMLDAYAGAYYNLGPYTTVSKDIIKKRYSLEETKGIK